MELKKFESKEDYLLVTLEGPVSFSEAIAVLTKVREVATERGFDKVLVDCRSVRGELSSFERYELGKTMAGHWLKECSGTPKVALVGKPPTINGFGALVAANRGFLAKTFSELPKALNWLNRFDSKANARKIPHEHSINAMRAGKALSGCRKDRRG